MKFLKDNKGVLIFYLLLFVFTIIISNNNQRVAPEGYVYAEK